MISSKFAASSQEIEVAMTEEAFEMISDVVYTQPPKFGYPVWPLRMDILRPAKPGVFPLVVFVPGGAMMSANKDNYLQQRVAIAKAGYVVASIEYRVVASSTFPGPLQDVKSAIRYLRAKAKRYKINPEFAAVMGESAGGYLAAITGTTNGIEEFDKGDYLEQSSNVNAVIDIYGLSDLTKIAYGFSEEVQPYFDSPSAPHSLWVNGPAVFGSGGGSIQDNPEKAAAANPITYITKDAPPFLFLHGDQDITVSPYQTEILHKALRSKGVDSTRFIVRGAEHGGQHWVQPEILNIIINFLDEKLQSL